MLRYGLQEMHGRTIHLPARLQDRPDPGRDGARWQAFVNVSR